MATASAFTAYFLELANGGHDLSADSLKMALTNTAPSTSSDETFADITELAAGNGYLAGGVAVTVSSVALSGNIMQAIIDTVSITASGGDVGPFRYLVFYNTSKTDKLIMVVDYGEPLTIPDGDNITYLTNSAGNIRIK